MNNVRLAGRSAVQGLRQADHLCCLRQHQPFLRTRDPLRPNSFLLFCFDCVWRRRRRGFSLTRAHYQCWCVCDYELCLNTLQEEALASLRPSNEGRQDSRRSPVPRSTKLWHQARKAHIPKKAHNVQTVTKFEGFKQAGSTQSRLSKKSTLKLPCFHAF